MEKSRMVQQIMEIKRCFIVKGLSDVGNVHN